MTAKREVRRLAVMIVSAALGCAAPVAAQHEHGAQAGTGAPDHDAHRFSDAEAYARRFDDPARDAWQMPDKVIAALDIRPGMTVADIGAGTGYFAMRLAKLAASPTVYAVDIEPSMVKYLESRAAREHAAGVVPVLASADSANLPRPVNVVLIVNTYHHIANRVEYFRRLRRSIAPEGRLAIVDFRKDSPEGPPVEFRFAPEQITSELQQAGFSLAARHDFLPRQHFLVYQVGQ